MAGMETAPRLLVCTETFPPQVTGSSVVAWRLLAATAPDVRYLVATAIPGRSAPGIDIVAADLPSLLYRRDLRIGLSDFFRILSIPYLARQFAAAARSFRPDAVVSVYPSDRFLLAGHRIARALGVPHAVYFHNLWEEAVRHTAVHAGCAADRARLRLAGRWEREIVRLSRARFALTAPMAVFLSGKHGVPFSVLPHAFPPPPPLPPGEPERRAEGLDLLLPGSVYGMHASSLRILLRLVGERDGIRLSITTGQKAAYLESIGVSAARNLTIEHYPDESRFFRRMTRADACVVCLAHDGHSPEDVATALPTRAVESLRFGKPLLVVAPAESYLSRLVREHAAGIAASPDDARGVEEALDALLSESRRKEFSENARRLFDERFSTERVGPSWIGEARRLARHPA